jgi:N-acetyl-anhydromuramyl-L-alanine amidase AmpD
MKRIFLVIFAIALCFVLGVQTKSTEEVNAAEVAPLDLGLLQPSWSVAPDYTLPNIIWRGSPNRDANRGQIKYIIMHWTVGTFEETDRRFLNPASRVSAHYGISGSVIYQWVSDDEVAYHSGNIPTNQTSIGIEHDGGPGRYITEETYRSSIALVRYLSDKYNIPIDSAHIRRHSSIVPTLCPGTLDVDRIIREAKAN